jgi:hypothetical protein
MVYEAFQTVDPTTYVTPFETACSTAGDACKTYVTGRVSQVQKEATDRKQASFDKSYIDLQRTMDMDHNAVGYGIRNQDMLTLQNFIQNYNEQKATDLQYNKDISKRQFEINEYFYYNKLDTLFFLQVFFIVGLIMAIILYGSRTGFLTTRQSGMATLILTLLVVIVGLSRYFYTTRTRDHRLWHRRYFGSEDEESKPLLQCPGQADSPAGSPLPSITLDVNAILSEKTTKYGSKTYCTTKEWLNKLNDETIAYQLYNSGSDASALVPTPDSCSA